MKLWERSKEQILALSTVPTSSAASAPPGSSGTKQDSSTGKQSSGRTAPVKKRQSDRLSSVKKRTLAVVIVADFILLLALAYQMIWLKESLTATFDEKLRDLMGFYKFQYQERLTHMQFGMTLYTSNASDTIACQALNGDRTAQDEIQRRFGNDARGRSLEIAILTDTSGVVMGSAERRSVLGRVFNPHNIVTHFFAKYPTTSASLQSSVMIPRDVFVDLKSPEYSVRWDPRPDLASWADFDEVLTRVVLSPLQCQTSTVQGYLIMGKAWYPRQYDDMYRLVRSTSSSLVALFARGSDGKWVMPYSYNKPGTTGWASSQFPNVLQFVTDADIDELHAPGSIQTGNIEIGDVQYMYGSLPVQRDLLGSTFIDDIAAADALILYAEPLYPVQHTVSTALWWHVPFGIFMTLLSFATVNYTFAKFVNPLKSLIESVKTRKMSEFNDQIRQMKQSRATLWTLLVKTVLVQGVLLSLVFVNRQLLWSSIHDFTSATSQGHVGAFVTASRMRSITWGLNGWTGFGSIIKTLESGNVTDVFRDELQGRFRSFSSDAIYLLTRESKILVSTYQASEGLLFPEVGLLDYFLTGSNSRHGAITALTNWHPANVIKFTPRTFTLDDPPAFVRVIGAPVNLIDFNVTDETTVVGDLVGVLVAVRVLNGYNDVWKTVVDAFGIGYYGLYDWDRYHTRFSLVSAMDKTETDASYGVDISTEYGDLLESGVRTSYRADSVLIQDSVNIRGRSVTVSVAPFFSPIDDVVLSPLLMSGYSVTGIPQDRYNDMLARQLAIQSTIMVIEFVTSMIALAFTYWPMKRFLHNLEKAFSVPSVSHDKRQRLEEKAAALMERSMPESSPQWLTSPNVMAGQNQLRP